ncbi:MAG: hypothetical protein ACYDIA_16170 [Candidatus Humimicrobiaceae bacterium]
MRFLVDECTGPVVANMGEQTVRYLGYYSNVCRGRRKRQNCDGADFIIAGEKYTKGCNNHDQG